MSLQVEALVAIEKLRARAQQLEFQQIEPIAMVGRLPRAPSPEGLW